MSYRNLKSFLPFVMGDTKYDRELHLVDRALMFGHEPAPLLHTLLGTGFTAHVLSYVYLWFLPLVPLASPPGWSGRATFTYGYWFATSQCIAWTLGTLSYYALPTLGPGFDYAYSTPTCRRRRQQLMDVARLTAATRSSTAASRARSSPSPASPACTRDHPAGRADGAVHVRIRWLQIVFWVNFGITVVATLYFGWHYIADDVAGVAIALSPSTSAGSPAARSSSGAACARTRPPPPRRFRSCATRGEQLHRCSASSRHADESEKSGRFGLTGLRSP